MSAKVLVLDDDQIIRLSLFHALTLEGFACSGCSTVDELVKANSALDPDVILIDLCLGSEDGLEAFAALAAQGCTAKIIVISGADIDVIEAAIHAATAKGLTVAGTLKKPFPLKELVRLIADNNSVIPTVEILDAPLSTSVTEEDLHNAILNRELSLVFQPKLDINTQSLAGAEVLCRWHSPKFGTVPPSIFIPIAEKSQDIVALTDYVMISAIQWLSEFLKLKHRFPAGLVSKGFHLSVNISGLSLKNSGFLNKLDTLIRDFRVAPSQLMLEMSESVAIGEDAAPPEILTRLRLKGYRLAVNDLGSGLASIQQLVRLPFSELKVDRRFVRTALTSYESSQITSTLIKMGDGLNFNVTAVGVENADLLAFLDEKGCGFAQGYHLASPMPQEEFSTWLEHHANEQIPYRITTVRSLKPMPSQREERFDRLARFVQRFFHMPVSAITILEQELCYLKAKVGIDFQSIPAENSLCYRLLPDKDAIIIPDVTKDEKASDSPLMCGDLTYRFFASHALRASNGCIFGSLFVADRSAGNWPYEKRHQLAELATIIEEEFNYSSAQCLDVISQLANKESFMRRADALVAFAAHQKLPIQVLKINLLSVTRPLGEAILRISKVVKSVFCDADDMGRTGESQLTILFLGRKKEDVIQQLIKLEVSLKALEEKSAVIDSLRSTHYFPTSSFGDSLQHIYCQPDNARTSHMIMRG